jgi:hypothetical protein
MKRTQLTAVLLVAALFFSGVVVGALAHRYYESSVVLAKPSESLRQRYVSDMRTKLTLSPEQVNKLEVILDDTKAKTKAVREQYHPAIAKIKEEQVERVKSILSPTQVTAYEQLVQERERRFRENEERDRQEDQRRAAARQRQVAP